MKANLPRHPVRWLATLALNLVVAGCAPPQVTQGPAPTTAVALPQAAPAPVSRDWRDAPIAPGEWRWSREGGQSVARFGLVGQAPALEIRCDRAGGRVQLLLPVPTGLETASPASPQASMTITTSTLTRPLLADAAAGASRLTLTLAVSDPLLDAMAFSRGRFRIETEGSGPLDVPSWPEVARVIEDCR